MSIGQAETLTPDRADRRSLALAMFMMFLVGIALALTVPLLSLEMERRGISSALNGLNTAVGGIGTIAISPVIPGLAARLQPGRIIVGSLCLAMILLPFFLVAPFVLWFPLRFLFGMFFGAIFIIAEYWIASVAPRERRGLIMGVYATALALGFAAGPAVLYAVGSAGAKPYFVGSAIFGFGLIPFLFVKAPLPIVHAQERPRSIVAIIAFAPAATLAALVFGAVETGAFGLLPVYGMRLGFGAESAAALTSIIALGNVASQIPFGYVADRFDRRKVLASIAVLGALGALAIPAFADHPRLLAVLLFVWGGIVGATYTVGLAQLASRFSQAELVTANAAFVMLYSIGSVAGPAIIGAAMDLARPHGYPLANAAIFIAYLAVVPIIRRRSAPAT